MTTPTITELPLQLEPTGADPFIDAGADRAAAAPVIRELDHRHSDGIDVRLLWNWTTDQIIVAVSDAKTGDAFELEIEGHQAMDAFQHPYAHAASRRISRHEATGRSLTTGRR
jgi:hypothetical protein